MKKNLLYALFFLPLLLWSGTPFEWSSQVNRTDAATVFTLKVAGGHYVDRESVTFDLKDASGKKAVPQFQGAMPEKFTPGQWRWQLPGSGVSGSVSWQGCSEDGMCFMPQEFSFNTAEPVKNSAAAPDDISQLKLIRKA